MRLGDTGPHIRALKISLNVEGRYGLRATDEYDYATERAVRDYQRRHGLNVTGQMEDNSFGTDDDYHITLCRLNHGRPDVDNRSTESQGN